MGLHGTATDRHGTGTTTHDWVVTYRLENCDRPGDWGIVEFYRGSEDECRRIGCAFAGGTSDIVATTGWRVMIGPAADWEDFLSEANESML
jgi:hypothetical protein